MSKKKNKKPTTMKPCPWCNTQDPEKYAIHRVKQLRQILCTTCGAFGPAAKTDIEAMQKWNSRIVSIVPRDVYDKLVEASEKKSDGGGKNGTKEK